MEEFIHKSLKDMNHGRTVEEGMKVLGMSRYASEFWVMRIGN